MSRLIDLTAKEFGDLTVLIRVDGSKPVRWRCQCTCGKTVDVLSSNLIRGLSTSCGCRRTKSIRAAWAAKVSDAFIDISGQRFGQLTAMRYDRKRHRWLCVCDCGGTCWCNVTELNTIRTDCGCSAARAAGERVKAGSTGVRNGTNVNMIQHIMDGYVRSNNSTGVTGVCRRGKKFQARIVVRGETISLGYYHTIEEAAAARKAAEEKYFKPLIEIDD